MDIPSSSSAFQQVRTKTRMPLTASSFRGVAARPPLSPKQFQPTSPTSTRSSFGASSSVNHGKSSELRLSPRVARSDVPSPFMLHSESPTLAGKENANSGITPFSRTEAPMVGSSSDMAPISWKDCIPLIKQEVRRINLGKQLEKTNVENKSKDYLYSLGTIREVEEPDRLAFGDDTDIKDQSKSSYGMPRTDSVQSFGSVFNLHEYFPAEINEGSKQGKQSQVVDVQNQNRDSLFSFGTVGDYENTDGFSFSNYINKDQFGDFHARPGENSTKSLRAQSPRKNIDSLSFGNHVNSRNNFSEYHETPLTSSIQPLDTQSLGSSFSFGDYLPKTSHETTPYKLGEQAEKFSVQNQKSDRLLFGTGTGGEKTGNVPFRDNVNRINKTEKAFEMPPTNSTENLSTLSLNLGFNFDEYLPEITQTVNSIHLHPDITNVEEMNKHMFLSGSAGEGAKTGSSFTSPVAGFAFTSKSGKSEPPKKETRGPRHRYIKIQKRNGHKTQDKKIDDSSAVSKLNFEESSSFKPRGNASYPNLSSTNTPFFSTSTVDANINGSISSYGSFTGTRTDGPSSLSGSKNSDKKPVLVSEPHFAIRNMSKIGHSSFKVRNAPLQFGSPDLLRTFSFPSKPRSGLGSEKIHEFPNIGKYGTSRSSGMNDGEKWQARGTEVYEKGDIKSAEEFFTQGIKSLASDETYQSRNRSLVLCYSNRAAVRMSLGQIREALSDCLVASRIDPIFPKVQLQIANCLVSLGNLEEAIKQFNKFLELNNNGNSDPAFLSEASSGLDKANKVLEYVSLAENLMKLDSDQGPKALDLISDALSISSHSDRLMEMKANALLKLRRYEDAIQYCEQIPNSDGKDYISKLWRLNIIAKSYFSLGKLDESLEVIKRNEQAAVDSEWYESDSSSSQIENIEPYENKFAAPDTSFIATLRELARLKEAGNEAFYAGQYTEAVEHYSAALACNTESCFFTAICLRNRAAAYQALGMIVDAIADCSLAIALHPTDTKAFSRRATLYDIIRDYNQAASDLRMVIFLLEKQQQENQAGKPSNTNISNDLNQAHRRLLSAEESAKKRIPLNPYLILGVDESASVDGVEVAYEKSALRHHPDEAIQSLAKNGKADNDATWLEVTGRVQNDADHLFKIIGEAYDVLSDTTKRAQYDLDEKKMYAKKTLNAVGTSQKMASGKCCKFQVETM